MPHRRKAPSRSPPETVLDSVRRRLPLLLFLLTSVQAWLAPAPALAGSREAAGSAVPSRPPSVFGVVKVPSVEVRFLDVGQGDAALIRTADGRTVLVDAGPRSAAGPIASEVFASGSRRIDLFILSHAHLDHVGGFVKLAGRIPVLRYLDPGFVHESEVYEETLLFLKERSIPYLKGLRGRHIGLGQHASLEVLAPDDRPFLGTRSDVNANSVVVRLDAGDICVLFTGDVEAPAEDRLVRSGQRIECPVLKVPHHGSPYSTTPALVAAVRPRVAVVSVGKVNGYGHPADEVLDRLERAGARVFRTDLDGTVVVRTDGKLLSVMSSRRPNLALPVPGSGDLWRGDGTGVPEEAEAAPGPRGRGKPAGRPFRESPGRPEAAP